MPGPILAVTLPGILENNFQSHRDFRAIEYFGRLFYLVSFYFQTHILFLIYQ